MMKAITLWQPWASLMAANLKLIETRGQLTHYRGELAICAAKRPVGPVLDAELCRLIWLNNRKFPGYHGNVAELLDSLPLGKVLCVVEVCACISTETMHRLCKPITNEERLCGNYTSGRFGWLTRDCKALKEPVPVVGRQGLFNLPPDVEAAVRAQL